MISVVWRGFAVPCAIVCLCSLAFCGCGKKEKAEEPVVEKEVATGRMADKEYVKALSAHQDNITDVAGRRDALRGEMEAASRRVKEGLPADATKEEFDAALAQDAEWQGLLKREALLNTNTLDVLRAARGAIRERMLTEQRENAAKSAGL